jgi:acyl-[acyl-carrier-protein]-phospholipid O-acyltransferase/long-chain-fatty-acid--[acyl-carrier-protein] ligase
VIFSSGSTGKPKGIMLSHHNILSNIEPLQIVFRLKKADDLCVVLPSFHSFGYTCAMWLPLVIGVSTTYCPNPLDGATVGKAVYRNSSTVLFAAPTFLLNYLRRAAKEDFASLRAVVVGAEKLKDRIADSFQEKFGIRPLEGYGATECSPVISLNLPNVESDGVYQVGNKPGSVGHPIPGVAVRIIDVETGQQLSTDQPGLVMVKGPNVMRGYLGDEDLTRQAVTDGWYNTGDVASMDEDGFLTLTDRLSRFSKIAGEMVPHIGVEDVFLDAIGADEQVVAVSAVPDAKRGEELVVLYTEKAGDPDKLHELMSNSDIPNVWKPKRENYVKVESMPTLGSGKLDVARLKQIALAAKKSGD